MPSKSNLIPEGVVGTSPVAGARSEPDGVLNDHEKVFLAMVDQGLRLHGQFRYELREEAFGRAIIHSFDCRRPAD